MNYQEDSALKRDASKLLGDNQRLYEQNSGYLIYKLGGEGSDCEISFVEIDNAQKGRGKGTALMRDFMSDMRLNGVSYFSLDATVTDEAVLELDDLTRFYEKFGFTEVERYNIDERTLVAMEYDLPKEVSL